MGAIEEARNVIEARLREIRDEERRLERALSHLHDRKGDPRPRKTRRSQKSRSRKRAPRGQRRDQLLQSIEAHPEFRQVDHARALGIGPSQVYPLVNGLVEAGKVRKAKSGVLELV